MSHALKSVRFKVYTLQLLEIPPSSFMPCEWPTPLTLSAKIGTATNKVSIFVFVIVQLCLSRDEQISEHSATITWKQQKHLQPALFSDEKKQPALDEVRAFKPDRHETAFDLESFWLHRVNKKLQRSLKNNVER